MKHAKRIGSLICVIAICFTLMAAPSAHAIGALGGQSAGALVAAGLVALNIVAHTGAQAIGSYFGWQSSPTSQSVLEYTFPYATSVISDYMNAATIKVDQGVTTIDGVEYDELWIEPGTFTNGLKTNLFDFKTKWSILSGQTGTLATGEGYAGGLPIYKINGTLQSQKFRLGFGSASIGDINFSYLRNDQYRAYFSCSGPISPNPYNFDLLTNAESFQIRLDNDGFTSGAGYVISDSGSSYRKFAITSLQKQPFDYSYVSGIVPAEETDIPNDYGLSIQIPHDKLQTFYNIYPQYNVDNSVINIQEDQVNIDELTQAIFDQIQSMEDIKADWKAEEEPEPPVPVDPIENIDDNVQSINEYQQNMNQQVNHMHQDVEAIHQTQQQQQQVQQQMQQDTSSIHDTLKDVTETPGQSDLPSFKFDLRELFPFCIPFDIYRLLSNFDAEPQAPHVQLPIVIDSIGFSYMLDLDFSAWNPVAQAMRTAELIVYAIALAWATGKVIKW